MTTLSFWGTGGLLFFLAKPTKNPKEERVSMSEKMSQKKSSSYSIAVLPGDGIGPEVVQSAIQVLNRVSQKRDLTFDLHYAEIGGAAIDASGDAFPPKTRELIQEVQAVLLGSVGGPKWDHLPPEKSPEIGGLLALRKAMKLYANLRPVTIPPSLQELSPLKESRLSGSPLPDTKGGNAERGVDFVVVRELSSGVYFGEPKTLSQSEGVDTMRYRSEEVERIARDAFLLAKKRQMRVCSIDKANVLASSRLWRECVTRVHAEEFPEVTLEHQYVDNTAMQFVLNPQQFDVVLTGNLFGDILSDIGAALCGSLGLLPSASLGESVALYEPSGGSAPDIANQDKANPIAQILSVAMMLEGSFNLVEEGTRIRQAISSVIGKGIHTQDIATKTTKRIVGLKEMTECICEKL